MAALRILQQFNPMLATAGTAEYATLQAAVEAADTLRDAVEAVGILDAVEEDLALETRAALDSIPAAAEEAVIAALESAFERNVPVYLEWVPVDSETIEVRVSEEPDGDGIRVRIGFASPNGRVFLEQD